MARNPITAVQVLDALASDPVLEFDLYGSLGEPCTPAEWASSVEGGAFSSVTSDSRQVEQHALFVCKGAAFNVAYLHAARASGAGAYVSSALYEEAGAPAIVVNDVRRAMARLACIFYGDPSRDLDVVGITGTKGKTTVAYYIDAVLRLGGSGVSGLFTGVVVDDGLVRTPAVNTTAEPIELQAHLANARDAGCRSVVMEVSSQALKYHRTLGTEFAIGVFTNLGEDHISDVEHPTFEDYFASKLLLFGQSRNAVVNVDMERASEVLEAARHSGCAVTTYSADPASNADVRVVSCCHADAGTWALQIQTPRGPISFELHALGSFNVSNALAAVCVAEILGLDHGNVARALARVAVPGRMERYDVADGSIVGIVDYAHNEMSLSAVLGCVRDEFAGREVTVVFGSAGDRGTSRRPGLGRAALAADRIIITEDDPARVSVEEIAEEIGAPIRAAGRSYRVVCNRGDAVVEAVMGANRPAVVVLAGKGTEDTIRRAQGTVPCPTDAELFRSAVALTGLELVP